MTEPAEERPELVIRMKVAPSPGGIFEAVATCELAGETFEGKGIDAGAQASRAMAGAAGNLFLAMGNRALKFQELGPDVVIRESARPLQAALALLFTPIAGGRALPPFGGPRITPRLVDQRTGAVAGDLVESVEQREAREHGRPPASPLGGRFLDREDLDE